jgi:protein CpxP
MKTTMIRKFAVRMGAVAMCSAALCSVPMMAQGGGRMSPEARVAMIDKAVTLTDEQKTKITAIFADDQKKMADLRAAQDPDMRTKMVAMRADENTKIKAMLTADQKTKFDAMPQPQYGRGGGGGAGAPPAPPAQ